MASHDTREPRDPGTNDSSPSAASSKAAAKKASKKNKSKGGAKTDDSVHATSSSTPTTLPSPELQQDLLDVFKESFSDRLGSALPGLIQEVKGHLYDRDFSSAFGSEEFLEAYALRWAPARALAYLDLFWSLPEVRHALVERRHQDAEESLRGLKLESDYAAREGGTAEAPRQVTCFGAGSGAEAVAMAGLLSCCRGGDEQSSEAAAAERDTLQELTVKVIDQANWKGVLDRLQGGIENSKLFRPRPDEGPSAALCPLKIEFDQQNVLSMPAEALAAALRGSRMMTIIFTLNELYTASMSEATNFLLSLTLLTSPGALLLVVDSPGSYSTVRLKQSSRFSGTAAATPELERRYPMEWLLDHTLLKASSIGSSSSKTASGEEQWEKIYSTSARWFRLGGHVEYAMDMEDMRYQAHLYRRTEARGSSAG
jgi:25S rRNA (uracil2843-N3)-methyltransferase